MHLLETEGTFWERVVRKALLGLCRDGYDVERYFAAVASSMAVGLLHSYEHLSRL